MAQSWGGRGCQVPAVDSQEVGRTEDKLGAEFSFEQAQIEAPRDS